VFVVAGVNAVQMPGFEKHMLAPPFPPNGTMNTVRGKHTPTVLPLSDRLFQNSLFQISMRQRPVHTSAPAGPPAVPPVQNRAQSLFGQSPAICLQSIQAYYNADFKFLPDGIALYRAKIVRFCIHGIHKGDSAISFFSERKTRDVVDVLLFRVPDIRKYHPEKGIFSGSRSPSGPWPPDRP
jgi:hypothetical protein